MSKQLHVFSDFSQPVVMLGLPGGTVTVPMSYIRTGYHVAKLPVDGTDVYFTIKDAVTGKTQALFNGDWYKLPGDMPEAWLRSGAVLDVDPDTIPFDLIDSHTHPYNRDGGGRMVYDDKIMLELLPRQGVGMAVTMTAGPLDRQRRRMAALCKGRPWIVPLVWVHARQDTPEQVEVLLRDHGFRGMKFHPTVDRYATDGPAMDGFLDLAERYNVPVQIHSATDDRSRPERFAELAGRHPRVPVIMVHTELGALSKGAALETIRELPNLIAETSWVSPEGILETMALLGSERALYGTDATVDGHAQYDRHSVPNCHGHFIYRLPDVVAAVRKAAPAADFANWAHLNAIRLYQLRLAPAVAGHIQVSPSPKVPVAG
ncbi:MAG: amidohydrolase family protein [Candidatus Sericytochromatia bacterium]|nr:amidohydrolase family protein [Candidatus Sericytochromatia bacterium]